MRRCLVAAAAAWACLACGAMAGGLNGPYVGLTAGYGVAATPYSPLLRGPMIGVRAGFDWMQGGVLLGVEGQVSASGMQGSNTQPGFASMPAGVNGPTSLGGNSAVTVGSPVVGAVFEHFAVNSDWQVDVTGRIGHELRKVDVYLLGGLSAANNRMLDTAFTTWTGRGATILHDPISASAIHLGIVGGAGIETALSDHLSIFAEARYHHYFSAAYSFSNGATATEPFSAASISIGLDWHF